MFARDLAASLDEDAAWECWCGGARFIDVHDQVGDDDLPRGHELIDGRIHVPCRDCNDKEG